MTAPHTHACRATNCQKQIPTNLLMCMTHWRLVPAPLARAVTVAWHVRVRNPFNQTCIDAHNQAAADAIAAVQKKQERRIAEKSDTDGDLLAGLGL